jgi:molybdopterin converting factor subunit 1
MRVEVRLFALYREQAGQDRLHLDLPEGARIKDAKEALERLFPGLSLQGGMAAVNQALAQGETPLEEGDEVAFLPPVSGGQDSFGLTHEPLDLKALVDWATAPEYGAVVSFLGTTRSPNRGEEVAYPGVRGLPGAWRRRSWRRSSARCGPAGPWAGWPSGTAWAGWTPGGLHRHRGLGPPPQGGLRRLPVRH